MLEVGGGLGVLSEYLAPRVAHLHVVEIDRSLEPPLRDALEPFADTRRCTWPTRSSSTSARSIPAPGKVVANLPYGVAATVILKSIAELPGRDAVGGDGAARGRRCGSPPAPGSKAYGATSVLAQLACDVRFLRRVPTTVFHPEPNVESALVSLRRRAPAPEEPIRALVHAAFAHRRKALAGSLALAAGAATMRDAARPRSSSSATPPTPAPSGSARRSGHASPTLLGEERMAALRPR